MKRVRLAALSLVALSALNMPTVIAGQEGDIVVRGDVARIEIERILDADNVDTSRLSAREVAEAMSGIERGRAPEEFWTAYQVHVAAWKRLARVGENLERALAEQAIEASFDDVERIARRYRARLPVPPWQVLPTI